MNSPFTIATTETDISDAEGKNILFTDPKAFSQYIEKSAQERGKSCTETILAYCESRDIDPADISKLVTATLKSKIQVEMISAGLLPKTQTLE